MGMKAFPKPLRRDGKYGAITLTPEQEAWVRRYFPTTKGTTMRAMVGVSGTTLYRIVRGLGVSKTDATRARIWRAASRKGKETCERNGYYASLRGRPMPPGCAEATKEYWRRVREGKEPSPIAKMRERHPTLFRKMMAERGERRRKQIRMERVRLMSGMPQETRLRNIVLKRYTRSQVNHRRNALTRGYWFYEDCSERGGERYNIYYDNDTERSARFEGNLRKDGFNVLDGTTVDNDERQDN